MIDLDAVGMLQKGIEKALKDNTTTSLVVEFPGKPSVLILITRCPTGKDTPKVKEIPKNKDA